MLDFGRIVLTIYYNPHKVGEREERMGFLDCIIKSLFGNNQRCEDESEKRPAEMPIKNDIVCEKYRVKGKYPGTGRIRTREVVAWDYASDQEILQRAGGLVEPYEIEKIGFDKPTERQLPYAHSLGIIVPDDASKEDVSILITRAEEYKPIRQEKAPSEILEILIKKMGIYIPAYAGINEMNLYYFITLRTDEEKYAYFAMKVYAQSTGKNYHFIQDANPAEQKRFYDFAKKYKDNRSFVESYERYDRSEITITGKIKRKLKAYELANAFFYENL